MTKEEATKLLALIKVAYPSSYKDMDKDMTLATINMWHSTFPDVPYFIMEMALERFRRASKFAPTIADIYSELRNIHYTACQDACIAKTFDDKATMQKCFFIIEQTLAYKHEPESKIDYERISDDMLLESGERYQALPSGNEF